MSASEGDARYGSDSPYPPFTAVQSDQNEPFILMYESSADGEWKALGFITDRVTRRSVRIENFATGVADNTTVDFGFFGENGFESNTSSPGSDRLRIGENHERRIHELAVGIEPTDDNLLVGVESPSQSDIIGLEDDRTRGYDADSLTDFGAVSSDDTFTSEGAPTTALAPHPAQGLVRVDSEENGTNPMRFGFNNQTGGQVDLTARVYGAAYEVSIIESASAVRDLLYDPSVRSLTWGGQGNTSPNLPTPWKQSVTTVTTDSALQYARSVTGGNGR